MNHTEIKNILFLPWKLFDLFIKDIAILLKAFNNIYKCKCFAFGYSKIRIILFPCKDLIISLLFTQTSLLLDNTPPDKPFKRWKNSFNLLSYRFLILKKLKFLRLRSYLQNTIKRGFFLLLVSKITSHHIQKKYWHIQAF